MKGIWSIADFRVCAPLHLGVRGAATYREGSPLVHRETSQHIVPSVFPTVLLWAAWFQRESGSHWQTSMWLLSNPEWCSTALSCYRLSCVLSCLGENCISSGGLCSEARQTCCTGFLLAHSDYKALQPVRLLHLCWEVGKWILRSFNCVLQLFTLAAIFKTWVPRKRHLHPV